MESAAFEVELGDEADDEADEIISCFDVEKSLTQMSVNTDCSMLLLLLSSESLLCLLALVVVVGKALESNSPSTIM